MDVLTIERTNVAMYELLTKYDVVWHQYATLYPPSPQHVDCNHKKGRGTVLRQLVIARMIFLYRQTPWQLSTWSSTCRYLPLATECLRLAVDKTKHQRIGYDHGRICLRLGQMYFSAWGDFHQAERLYVEALKVLELTVTSLQFALVGSMYLYERLDVGRDIYMPANGPLAHTYYTKALDRMIIRPVSSCLCRMYAGAALALAFMNQDWARSSVLIIKAIHSPGGSWDVAHVLMMLHYAVLYEQHQTPADAAVIMRLLYEEFFTRPTIVALAPVEIHLALGMYWKWHKREHERARRFFDQVDQAKRGDLMRVTQELRKCEERPWIQLDLVVEKGRPPGCRIQLYHKGKHTLKCV